MKITRQELLKQLGELSGVASELRFGQMIANLVALARGAKPEAIWDVDDDELLLAAERLLNNYRTRSPVTSQPSAQD